MALRILHSIPSNTSIPARSVGGISVLLILDSSFNPPTKAHAFILRQAIAKLQSKHHGVQHGIQATSQWKATQNSRQARILLLLSTKNADKPSAPASTEQRVAMMRAFAMGIWDELLAERKGASTVSTEDVNALPVSGIDVGLSSEPLILEKSALVASPSKKNPYFVAMEAEKDGEKSLSAIPQWYLVGFDTLVRLLDGKYYGPSGSLDVLAPLFEGQDNRVLVVRRGEEGKDQEEYVQKLSISHDRGGFSGKGWKVDWGQKVDLLPAFEGVQHNGKMVEVSSTAVRKAAKEGDVSQIQTMCLEHVAEYVVQEGLYKE